MVIVLGSINKFQKLTSDELCSFDFRHPPLLPKMNMYLLKYNRETNILLLEMASGPSPSPPKKNNVCLLLTSENCG